MLFTSEFHSRFVEQAAWTKQAQSLLIQSAGFHPQSKILEVGCGTCAAISSLNSISIADYYGIDIQYGLLDYAKNQKNSFPLTCADALVLPFRDGAFDAVICHYFLLWIKNIANVLAEMRRVVRSGGIIAALAEPDYGSRIDHPKDFEFVGKLQRDSLIRQGANPDIGRQLAEIFTNSGCKNLATGILGSYQPNPLTTLQISSEQNLLISDIQGTIDMASFQNLLDMDTTYRMNNSRVEFIPTFFCWGRNP
jgi:ubiquinone/menaquinone biosynthesis C-methylase UbiE